MRNRTTHKYHLRSRFEISDFQGENSFTDHDKILILFRSFLLLKRMADFIRLILDIRTCDSLGIITRHLIEIETKAFWTLTSN